MPSRFTLTSEQRQQFLADGFLRVSGIISSEATDAMAERIWEAIAEQRGVLRDQPDTWKIKGMVHPPVNFRKLTRAGAFAAVFSPEVCEVLDNFFGDRGWHGPHPYEPRPLGVIFPTLDGPWTIPTRSWHTDGTGPEVWPDRVRLFACLAPIMPGGGGTFYVAGSHRAVVRLVQEMSASGDHVGSATVIKRLKQESPWIADLGSRGEAEGERVARFMDEGVELAGVPLRVAEMTGEAGDVILWHPNLLHTAPRFNRRSTPRMVISATLDASP